MYVAFALHGNQMIWFEYVCSIWIDEQFSLASQNRLAHFQAIYLYGQNGICSYFISFVVDSSSKWMEAKYSQRFETFKMLKKKKFNETLLLMQHKNRKYDVFRSEKIFPYTEFYLLKDITRKFHTNPHCSFRIFIFIPFSFLHICFVCVCVFRFAATVILFLLLVCCWVGAWAALCSHHTWPDYAVYIYFSSLIQFPVAEYFFVSAISTSYHFLFI